MSRSIVEILNELRPLLFVRPYSEHNGNVASKVISVYVLSDQMLCHSSDNQYPYNQLTNELYEATQKASKTLSFSKFMTIFYPFLFEITSSKDSTKYYSIYERSLKEIDGVPVEEFLMLHPLYYCFIETEEKDFGKFKVLSAERVAFYYNETVSPNLRSDIEWLFANDNRKSRPDFYVMQTVRARDIMKASELAEPEFEKFENLLYFLLGDISLINIFNPGIKDHNGIIGFGEFSGTANDNTVRSSGYNLSHLEWFNNNGDYGILWELISNTSPTEIEGRIIDFIYWISMGLKESNRSKAFLLNTVGIESLLKNNKREFISPSIVYSIAESVAFVLETDHVKRKEVFNNFKSIYDKRSKIVHSGYRNEIKDSDYRSLYEISYKLVDKILLKEPFCKAKNLDELHEMIEMLKFSNA